MFFVSLNVEYRGLRDDCRARKNRAAESSRRVLEYFDGW